jgi:acyl dehydratase
MPRFTVADIADSAGLDLGRSDWIVVDQSRIDLFAEVTEDRQWIHIDPERASASPFGRTIAHGYLTLSLVSTMLSQLLTVTDATSALNYGLDRVRFPAPVPEGSRIRGHGLLVSARRLDAGIQTTTRITVECSASTKPVAVADVLTRFLR